MSYNDGQVHLDFYDQKENFESIATEFSEGDPLLKESLLALWRNGIKTVACCRGHEEKNHEAYLSLIINENSEMLIQATCEYLYLPEVNLELDFTKGIADFTTFAITMETEQDKINYLNFLNAYLKQNNKTQEFKNNILLYGSYLLDFAKKTGLTCRFGIIKDKMMFGYNYPGYITIFSDKAPHLDELIDSIIETGNLPLTGISCNEKSLEQFINIFYPNTFEIINDKTK